MQLFYIRIVKTSEYHINSIKNISNNSKETLEDINEHARGNEKNFITILNIYFDKS